MTATEFYGLVGCEAHLFEISYFGARGLCLLSLSHSHEALAIHGQQIGVVEPFKRTKIGIALHMVEYLFARQALVALNQATGTRLKISFEPKEAR